MHVIAAKAVAFGEALRPDFKVYQKQLAANAKELALALEKEGFRIVSGGTDTHLILVDLTKKNITGAEASSVLGEVNITVNKNLIPFDKLGPAVTSGIRLGSAAVSTRKMGLGEMSKIAELINRAIEARLDQVKLKGIKEEVINLTKKFPLYPELTK